MLAPLCMFYLADAIIGPYSNLESKKEIGSVILLPMMHCKSGWINIACIFLQVGLLDVITVFFDHLIYRLKIACKFSI